MAKELTQRIFDSVQSSLNTTVQTLQAAVNQPYQFGSSFYPSTLDQMENVKSGWLRKQGGIVRNWHRRYFVLKGDYIYYYTSDEDGLSGKPPLGSIFLPGNHVVEIPYNPTDVEKFQFEIQIADRTRTASTRENYLLSAESEDDRKDWMKVIKHVLYSVSGGAIFGQSLEETLKYEMRDGTCKVPHIVSRCIEYLRDSGLKEEGLFRLPGRNVVIRQLTEMFDRGERPMLKPGDPPDITLDVHTVASLLKLYLRELPEPLVPFSAYESVMRVVSRQLPLVGEDQAAATLGQILGDTLSAPNYNTLQCICQFLSEVTQYADVNKMNATNLATIFVQCFLQPDAGDDPALMLGTAAGRTVAAQLLITHCHLIFNIEYSPDGRAIVTGDLLGLDSGTDLAAGDSKRPPTVYNADLMGLDFTTNLPSIPSIQLRQNATRRSRPSTVVQQSNRGVVGCNDERSRNIVRKSMSVGENLNGKRISPTVLPETNGTINTDRIAGSDAEQDLGNNVEPIILRRSIRNSMPDGLAGPILPPKPAPRPKASRESTSQIDWQSQAEQLSRQLRSVEQERDEALARVKELEAEVVLYRTRYGLMEIGVASGSL